MAENDDNLKKSAHFTVDDLIAMRMMAENFKRMEQTLEQMGKKLETNFVKKEELVPIQRIVYGLVGLVLTSVFIAILSVVVTKN